MTWSTPGGGFICKNYVKIGIVPGSNFPFCP
jgi:hypothetical protein